MCEHMVWWSCVVVSVCPPGPLSLPFIRGPPVVGPLPRPHARLGGCDEGSESCSSGFGPETWESDTVLEAGGLEALEAAKRGHVAMMWCAVQLA
jgi:hypothetical protein